MEAAITTLTLGADDFERTISARGRVAQRHPGASTSGRRGAARVVSSRRSSRQPPAGTPTSFFGKVDTEAEQGLATAANITSIPTLMAFKDGALVCSQPGALPATALEQGIAAVRALDVEALRAEAASDPRQRHGPGAQMTYTLSTTVAGPYAETVASVRAALGEQGFGVLTEIDLAATLKAKLDVDLPPQIVLGACRPPLAYTARQADPSVAAMLPCNVVVRSLDETTTVVEAFDPDAVTSFSHSDAVRSVAEDAKQRLNAALDTLGGARAADATPDTHQKG